jgi:hypothetical protein
MSFYVYEYRDPRTNSVCYIGKGQRSRDKAHLRGSHNKRLNRLIEEMRKHGAEPVITRVADGLTNIEACALEIELIARYGRKGYEPGGVLLNHTTGGEGASGRIFSNESLRKLSESNRGKKRDAIARENIRQAIQAFHDAHPEAGIEHGKKLLGRPCPEHVREHLSTHFSKVRKGAGNPVAKEWIVTSPAGEIFCTNELVQFCKRHGLSYVGLKAAMRAGRPVTKGETRGWSLSLK